jgi:hypothetical protein
MKKIVEEQEPDYANLSVKSQQHAVTMKKC